MVCVLKTQKLEKVTGKQILVPAYRLVNDQFFLYDALRSLHQKVIKTRRQVEELMNEGKFVYLAQIDLIAEATPNEAATSTGAMPLGSTWRKMIRLFRAPAACAASAK